MPVVIFVSSRKNSAMFARSSVFAREELCCIIGLCRRHVRYFYLLYQITRMSGDPAVQRDKLCRLAIISLSVIFNMLRYNLRHSEQLFVL